MQKFVLNLPWSVRKVMWSEYLAEKIENGKILLSNYFHILNDSRGSCGDPRQYSHCPCCQSPIKSNGNTISCYLCGEMSIKASCLDVPSQLQCGQLLWKCPECVKISTNSIFQSMLEKLKKIDNIENDVKIMKEKLLIVEPS